MSFLQSLLPGFLRVAPSTAPATPVVDKVSAPVTHNQFLAGMSGSPWFVALDEEQQTWFRQEAKRSLLEGKTHLDVILDGYIHVSTMLMMQGKVLPETEFFCEEVLNECLEAARSMTAEEIQKTLHDFHSHFESRTVGLGGFPLNI